LRALRAAHQAVLQPQQSGRHRGPDFRVGKSLDPGGEIGQRDERERIEYVTNWLQTVKGQTMLFQYDPTAGFFDIALTKAGGIDAGVGNGGLLQSAIWTSLFTDGIADPADMEIALGDDRRGWCAGPNPRRMSMRIGTGLAACPVPTKSPHQGKGALERAPSRSS
jgi:hypothetical protein